MNIGEEIRTRRKAMKLTQEQVAERIGITPQAVYKWEKGLSCPDIALLAPLARLLKTDVNELLRFRDSLTDAEIARIVSEISEAFFKDENIEVALASAEQAMREFPNSEKLQLSLAAVLDSALGMRDAETAISRERIDAMYHFAAGAEDASIRDTAKSILAGRLINEKRFEEAEKMIESLPDAPVDKQQHRARLCYAQKRFDEGNEALESIVFASANRIATTLAMLISHALSEDDAGRVDGYMSALIKTVHNFGLWNFQIAGTQLNIAVHRKDVEATRDAFERMAEAMKVPWQPAENALYGYMHFRKDAGGLSSGIKLREMLVKGLTEDEELAFFRASPAFEKTLNLIRSNEG